MLEVVNPITKVDKLGGGDINKYREDFATIVPRIVICLLNVHFACGKYRNFLRFLFQLQKMSNLSEECVVIF